MVTLTTGVSRRFTWGKIMGGNLDAPRLMAELKPKRAAKKPAAKKSTARKTTKKKAPARKTAAKRGARKTKK
jgi:hypothetical protein